MNGNNEWESVRITYHDPTITVSLIYLAIKDTRKLRWTYSKRINVLKQNKYESLTKEYSLRRSIVYDVKLKSVHIILHGVCVVCQY